MSRVLPSLLPDGENPPDASLPAHFLRALPPSPHTAGGLHTDGLLPAVSLDYVRTGQSHLVRVAVGEHQHLGPAGTKRGGR